MGAKKKAAPGSTERQNDAKRRQVAAKSRDIVDPRLTTALGHPLRVHILGVVAQRALSPAQVARECGEPVSKVSYHFNVLRDCECIELTDEVPKRGAVEHFYRGTERALLDDANWKRLPKSVQGGATGVTLLNFFNNALGSVKAGTFDAREDRHLSWATLLLDEAAWTQMTVLLEQMREQIMGLAAESAERLAESGGEGINATVALAGYETSQARGDSDEKAAPRRRRKSS